MKMNIEEAINTLEKLRIAGISIDNLLNALKYAKESYIFDGEKEISQYHMKVIRTLNKLKMPTNCSGKNYIVDILDYLHENPEITSCYIMKLYSFVANKYNTTVSLVERSIRYSIERMVERADEDVLQLYFGDIIGKNKKGNIKSGEFISRMVEVLELE